MAIYDVQLGSTYFFDHEQLGELVLVVKDEGVSSRPPATQVLFSPDVRERRVHTHRLELWEGVRVWRGG